VYQPDALVIMYSIFRDTTVVAYKKNETHYTEDIGVWDRYLKLWECWVEAALASRIQKYIHGLLTFKIKERDRFCRYTKDL
jgi:hypothetical protein